MSQIIRDYKSIFVDKEEYPSFIDEYLATRTLKRLQGDTQFCGCDYTKIYNTKALYTRYNHSDIVAHMTWHFGHDKIETIKAVLHDHKTPCFAHTIDYYFGDYLNQEKSEQYLRDVIVKDNKLKKLLKRDGIEIEEVSDLSDCPILENKTPRLCTDRLDGVLHTGYIWLQTHSLDTIKDIYDSMKLLKNEDGTKEIGFIEERQCVNFAKIVSVYAKELQSARNKYVMMYLSELIKLAINNRIITLDDLYTKSESELIRIFSSNFNSWPLFRSATKVLTSANPVDDRFCVHIETKRRNTIPLLQKDGTIDRITNLSSEARDIYKEIDAFQEKGYGFVKSIKTIN